MRWAVVIAGGSGSRFWPLSTPAAPKQLLPLPGPRSTGELTVDRLRGLIEIERVLLVTSRRLAEPLARRLGIVPGNVLVEPIAKSTGPALAWASHEAHRRDPEATVLSVHADWVVADPAAFARAATTALEVAERDPMLVTVGVVPDRPETGYGYIVPGPALDRGYRVSRFVEKPSADRAAALVAAGALWNSGLFAWRATTLLDQIAAVTPELSTALPRLDRGDVAGFFTAAGEVSIDVGVLERSGMVAVVPGDFPWDDVGTWEALRRIRPRDAAGNVVVGDVTVIDGADNVVWSEHHAVVLAGVSDLVVVEANGRILVMDRRRAAQLKEILDRLPPRVREV